MDALWDPLSALFDVVGEGFDVVFALVASLASVFALSAGLVTLFFGRKLFWVFIGAAGFILGLNVAPVILEYLPASLEPLAWLFMLVIALTVGALCIVLQRLASVLAGALIIGGLAFLVTGDYGLSEWAQWALAVLFGLSGGILLYFFFDWTLILVTSLVGAVVALLGAGAYAEMPDAVRLWSYVILVVVGIAYQARDMRGEQARARAAVAKDGAPASGRPAHVAKTPLHAQPPAQLPPSPAAGQGTWPGAVQRPTTQRPPTAPAQPKSANAGAFQSSPQAWG